MEKYEITAEEFIEIFNFVQSIIEQNEILKKVNTFISGNFETNRLLFKVSSDDEVYILTALQYIISYFKTKGIEVKRTKKTGFAFINANIDLLKKLKNENIKLQIIS